jgi:hypothetical protein
MQLVIRFCAGATLALLIAGVVYLLASSFVMCLDGCPSPAAFPGAVLRQAGTAFGPCLLFALTTWVLYLFTLARMGEWQGLAIVSGGPLLLAVLFILSLALVPPAALLPTTAEEYGVWLWKVLLACLVMFGLMWAMLRLTSTTDSG